MEARLFNREIDLKKLNGLCEKNNMISFNIEDLPVMGIVIEKKKNLIAMGFLRQCEGFYGIMDSVITEPSANSKDRHEALNLLYEEIIKLARSMNISSLIGFSANPGIIDRSKYFGFMEMNHKLLSLKIRG